MVQLVGGGEGEVVVGDVMGDGGVGQNHHQKPPIRTHLYRMTRGFARVLS